MSTSTLKPRPVYKKQTVTTKRKTMTEQRPTVTKIESHLPEHHLISRDALWEDFKTRMSINNYEVTEAMRQLKEVVHRTHEVVLPTVDKAVSKFKEYTSDK